MQKVLTLWCSGNRGDMKAGNKRALDAVYRKDEVDVFIVLESFSTTVKSNGFVSSGNIG